GGCAFTWRIQRRTAGPRQSAAGGSAARWAYSRRGEYPVGNGGTRRWHVQIGGRTVRFVRGQGRHSRQRSRGVLSHWRAQQPYLVCPALLARLPQGTQL